MEIIIEVGDEEQKERIKSELSIIEVILNESNSLDKLSKIIIPQNFDQTINDLINSTAFKSQREKQIAIAKIIDTNEGKVLLFSPSLYTIDFDEQIRILNYIHETTHILYENYFPTISTNSQSELIYLTNINTMFNEYVANRKSLELVDKIFTSKSKLFKRHVNLGLRDHLRSLKDDFFYNKIKQEIVKFRFDGNVDIFLKATDSYADQVSKAVVYSFAYIDSNPRFKKAEEKINNTPFVNNKTIPLINFFRLLYSEENFGHLNEGFPLIKEFTENLGIRFEDVTEGLYAHVLDI